MQMDQTHSEKANKSITMKAYENKMVRRNVGR